MDNDEFKLNETGINPVDTASENNDVYFTNVKAEKNNEQSKIQKTAKAGSTVKKRVPIKKSQSLTSTYVFFIVVIALSMLISIYVVLYERCFGITKTTSTVTVSLDKSVDNIDDAIDILADNGLIKCKNFCKLFAKYREKKCRPKY